MGKMRDKRRSRWEDGIERTTWWGTTCKAIYDKTKMLTLIWMCQPVSLHATWHREKSQKTTDNLGLWPKVWDPFQRPYVSTFFVHPFLTYCQLHTECLIHLLEEKSPLITFISVRGTCIKWLLGSLEPQTWMNFQRFYQNQSCKETQMLDLLAMFKNHLNST